MKITSFLLFLVLIGCTYKKIDIKPDEFRELPAINYSEIIPFQPFDCWKLIYSFPPATDSTIFSSANCAKFDYTPNKYHFPGFEVGCLPLVCFKYIIANSKESLKYFSTPDSLRIFLGEIDNISEAQLLANGFDYYSKKESVFKSMQDGYVIIMYKLVKTGMPIQTDKFLLKILKNGRIKILAREVFSKEEHAII